MKTSRHFLAGCAVATMTASLGLTACSTTPTTDPADVQGIPEQWLTSTAEGWPDSDGYGASMPYLKKAPCLIADQPPDVLGGGAKMIDTGWGPYGDSDSGYRYICKFWLGGRYSGTLQLMQASSAEEAQSTLDLLRDSTSTAVQENTVSDERSGQLDIVVLKQWIPTNPQGSYEALYLDESEDALFSLEVNSLDADDFATLTPQGTADALVAVMAAGT